MMRVRVAFIQRASPRVDGYLHNDEESWTRRLVKRFCEPHDRAGAREQHEPRKGPRSTQFQYLHLAGGIHLLLWKRLSEEEPTT